MSFWDELLAMFRALIRPAPPPIVVEPAEALAFGVDERVPQFADLEAAYETVTADDGSLPLLVPMSEVAGRLSIQAGAFALQKANGGSGKLLGGYRSKAPATVDSGSEQRFAHRDKLANAPASRAPLRGRSHPAGFGRPGRWSI